jgi:hypothetical protein
VAPGLRLRLIDMVDEHQNAVDFCGHGAGR